MINKNSNPIFYGLIVASTLAMGAAQAAAQDGIISKTPEVPGNYCHLKFPAIVPRTLGTDHPQLEDPQSGDIIDYYGPCDHNPLGRDEVEQQEWDQHIRGSNRWEE